MIHEEQSELAGQTVRIKETSTHPQDPDFGGSKFRVKDWWDRVSGKPWGICEGNLACLIYAIRSGMAELPYDDEVLYGKVGILGHLVHISELELETASVTLPPG